MAYNLLLCVGNDECIDPHMPYCQLDTRIGLDPAGQLTEPCDAELCLLPVVILQRQASSVALLSLINGLQAADAIGNHINARPIDLRQVGARPMGGSHVPSLGGQGQIPARDPGNAS